MRIAVVTSLLPADTGGGAEHYAAATAASLAERHDVIVLTGSEAHDADGLPTRRLPRLPIVEGRNVGQAGRIFWHARDQWLPSVHLALVRELTRLEPDVVATHHPQGLSAAVFTAVARTGLPHVHTAHDLNLACARMTMTRDGRFCGGRCAACLVQRRIRGTALRRSLGEIVVYSEYMRQQHLRSGIAPAERIHLIRLGAPSGEPRVRSGSAESLRLGFIGTVAPHKGVLTLLDAFAGTPPGWRLDVAGGGPLADSVAARAAADPRITYLGRVDGAAKDAFFDALDLVVIPSEWEEPATFVAMEAAFRGVPAVVSDRGGLPETPHARTFRAGDADDLMRAVRWFVDEPGRLAETSKRLLASRDEFAWSRHAERVEALMTRLVDAGRGHSAA
jgi:glycosyltransferase involved in cell wall biosynthesis